MRIGVVGGVVAVAAAMMMTAASPVAARPWRTVFGADVGIGVIAVTEDYEDLEAYLGATGGIDYGLLLRPDLQVGGRVALGRLGVARHTALIGLAAAQVRYWPDERWSVATAAGLVALRETDYFIRDPELGPGAELGLGVRLNSSVDDPVELDVTLLGGLLDEDLVLGATVGIGWRHY